MKTKQEMGISGDIKWFHEIEDQLYCYTDENELYVLSESGETFLPAMDFHYKKVLQNCRAILWK